ncbi:hypothetical protein BJV82DRAFT_624677 [Fennellomyces sp. T-0311]|nr:hypothetical protein BJV82DRAFT_624677 [Fennellomyces sp. T-0311]
MSPSEELPLSAQPGDAFPLLTVRALDATATYDVFERGKHAYALKNYTEAAALFTLALQTLQSDLLSVILLHRAAAYEMEQKYDLAVIDCHRAIPDEPSPRADAYFAKANALLLQNDLNGAFRVYEKGTKCVPQSSTQHAELVTRRDQLLVELDKQNRWMARRLPLELVYNVLSYLPMRSRAQLASTCRFWHNIVLRNWADMWATIDVTTKDVPKYSRGMDRFLQAVSPDQVSTVKLDLYDVTTIDLGVTVDTVKPTDIINRSRCTAAAMVRLNWNNIVVLEIHNPSESPFCSILEFVKDTLQILKIRSAHDNNYHAHALDDAARICPNLRSVTQSITGRRIGFDLQLGPVLHPSDLHLAQLILSSPIASGALAQLLENSPYLTSLVVNADSSTHHTGILRMIHRHCRVLRTLSYIEGHSSSKLEPTYSLSPGALPNDGLQSLEIQIRTSGIDGTDKVLGMILRASCSTLETLKIDAVHTNVSDILQSCALKGITRLRTLDIKQSCGLSSDLCQFISACRSLEIATFRGSLFWCPEVLSSIQQLPLRRLAMIMDDKDTKPCNDAASSMKTLIAQMHELSNFTIGFGSQHNLPDHFVVEVAQVIGDNSSIRELDLQSIPMSNSQLVRVLDNLKDSQVRKLKLELLTRIGVKVLKVLKSFIHLEYLQVHYPVKRSIEKRVLDDFFDSRESERLLVLKITTPMGQYVKGSRRTTVAPHETSL